MIPSVKLGSAGAKWPYGQPRKVGVKRRAASPRPHSSSLAGFLLLSAWIVAHTVGLDVLHELKPYDILGVAVIIMALGKSGMPLNGSDRWAVWSRWLLLIAGVGSLFTIVAQRNILWLGIVVLRLFRFFSYLCAYAIFRRLPIDRKQLGILLDVVFYSSLVQAVLIILQGQGLVPILWPAEEQIYGRTYPTGTLALNHLNSVLFMSVGICAAIAKLGVGGSRRVLSLVASGLSIPAMVTAMTLGEARTTMVAVGVMGFGVMFRRRAIVALLLSIAAVSLLPLASHIDPSEQLHWLWTEKVVARVEGEQLGTQTITQLDQSRPAIWRRTLEALGRRPVYLLVGAGFQGFSALDIGAVAAHNVYLHVLAELGIAGLIVFLFWLRSIWRDSRSSQSIGREGTVVFAARLCLAVLVVTGFLNESLYPSRAIPGFMGFALAFLGICANPGWHSPRLAGRTARPQVLTTTRQVSNPPRGRVGPRR